MVFYRKILPPLVIPVPSIGGRPFFSVWKNHPSFPDDSVAIILAEWVLRLFLVVGAKHILANTIDAPERSPL